MKFDAVDRAEKARIDFVVLAMPVVVNAGPVFYVSQALHSLPWIPLDNGLHALARSL